MSYFSSFEPCLLVGGPFCVSNCCLAECCFFSSFGLVLGGLRKDRVFYDTVFWHFGILDFLRFFLGCCYFSSFGLVLSGLGIIVCVCVTSGFCFEVVEFCCCDACMSTMAMMM